MVTCADSFVKKNVRFYDGAMRIGTFPNSMRVRGMFLATIFLLALAGCSLPQPSPSANPESPFLLPTVTHQISIPPTAPPAPTFTPVPDAELALAEYALLEGNWPAAESGFRAGLAAGGDSARASYGLARALYSRGDFAGAADALQSLLSSPPSDEYKLRSFFLMGEVLDAQSKWEEAAAAYQRGLVPGSGLINDLLEERAGDALLSAKHPDQAAQVFAAAVLVASPADRPRLTEKEADSLRMAGSPEAALQLYDSLFPQVASDNSRARLQRKAGLTLLDLDRKTEAYSRYQTALQYTTSYDAYLCLADLLDTGHAVDEYQRGAIDFYAGQYEPAIAALSLHLTPAPDSPGPALYLRGLSYFRLDQADAALQDMDSVIHLGSSSGVWESAVFDKAYIEWFKKDDFSAGWQTLVAFVEAAPDHPRAAEALYEAGRIAERGNDLAKAAELWKRVADAYPASSYAADARHFSGIALYRGGKNEDAETAFHALSTSADLETQARAWFWVAKARLARGDSSGGQQALSQAAQADPTGYYSLRASDLLAGRAPFFPPASSSFDFNLDAEYAQAAAWIRQQKATAATPSAIPQDESAARNDPRLTRGRLLWDLGLYSKAQTEFDSLRTAMVNNPLALLYLSQYFQQIGYYPGAISAASQALKAVGVMGTASFEAPMYFNHIRFGPFFRDLILPASKSASLDPLLLFALVRLESPLFDIKAASPAGALGLMQLMPATARDVAKRIGLGDLSDNDISRPVLNLRLGTSYLASQRDLFDGNMFLALAAYNGGPGNAASWQTLSNGDDDLLVETIRFEETRLYIRIIYEYHALYRRFYGTPS
jgi:soluble lytic murein transglycosylase